MTIQLKNDVSGENLATGGYPDRYDQIPPNGRRCGVTGLGHSRMYQLLNGPAKHFVRVVSLREAGAKRGTRLFHVGDLLRYLDKLAADQSATNQLAETVTKTGRKVEPPIQ